MTPDDEVKKLAARVAETQARLGQLSKLSAEREAVKAEMVELLSLLARKKDEARAFNALRVFAGLTTPFADACRSKLEPQTVAELEALALAVQEAREQAARERKAAKAAAAVPAPPPPPPPPKPAGFEREQIAAARRVKSEVEVLVRRPTAGGAVR